MRKKYKTPELLIEHFDDGDIVARSGDWGGGGGGEWGGGNAVNPDADDS